MNAILNSLCRKKAPNRRHRIKTLVLWLPASIAFCAISNLSFGQSTNSQVPRSPRAPRTPSSASTSSQLVDDNSLFSPTFQIHGAQPPFTLRAVFRNLGSAQTVIRPFSESRTFGISKHPTALAGVMRYSRQKGLSLAYDADSGKIVIIDDQGLIERSPDGHERTIFISDHPELSAVTDTYLNLLRGNSGKLLQGNDVYFQNSTHGWKCGLVPKDSDISRRVGKAILYGLGHSITQIKTISPSGDVRVIELGAAQKNVKFSPEVIQNFFRG